MRRRFKAFDVLIVVATAAVFMPLSLRRFLDGDEGVYALASKLVTHGEVPYRDFAYPQMPLLPYVYGAWMWVAGESWASVRVLSALLAVALGCLLYAHVLGRTGRPAAVLALVLYAASGLVFEWLTTVKSYSLSAFLLFGAYSLVDRAPTRRRVVLGGIVLGLGIGTRLLLAGAVPAFLIYLLASRRARRAGTFLAGLCLGLVPSVVFLAVAPDAFVFDNIGYQGVRSPNGLIGDLPQKLRTVANLFGYGVTDREAGLQLALLFVAAVVTTVVVIHRERYVPLAVLIALAIGISSLLPTPTYTQYFCVAIPFVIVAALELSPVSPRRALVAVVAVATTVYVAAGVVDYARYLSGPIPITNRDAELVMVERVAAVVNRNTRPGEPVMVSWPGYLLGTHAAVVPGFEDQFTPAVAGTLNAARARRLHFLTPAQIEAAIESHRSRIAVFRPWTTIEPTPDWAGALARAHYRRIARIGGAEVYSAP